MTIEPAVGLHTLEVLSRVESAEGVLRLLWQPPPVPMEGEASISDEDTQARALEPIPAGNLYHGDVRPLGLAGRFFGAAKDAGQIADTLPDALQVTPGVGEAFWYNSVVDGQQPGGVGWDA